MLFNSLHFLIFFPVVTFIFLILPQRFRWILLLAASCYFYLVFIPAYLLILFFLILVDFIAGILIEKAGGQRRKLYLSLSLVANIAILAVFKYFNFFNSNIAGLFRALDWNYAIPNLNMILPIGLSFHTFQSMSYTIEVYRGHQPAEKHLGIYALYVMFYPQLVAGPIERPQNLLHQFYTEQKFDYRRVTDGMKLMMWGLIKKVVIADRLAVVVNTVYSNPTQFNSLQLLIATYFFAFQIYCDFSGYSDIAIGAAQVMGYKLMTNFNRPYFSKSIAEFWKRWHISLSTWFRDYLYIPLGGNRVGKKRWYLNLFLVFLVSGLWHGANWTFLIWGALHGFYLIFALWSKPYRETFSKYLGLTRFPTTRKLVQILITFHLVLIAWVFFRANSVSDALFILTQMVNPEVPHQISVLGEIDWRETVTRLGLSSFEFLVALLSIGFLETVHLLQRQRRLRDEILSYPVWARWSVYYGCLALIILLGKFTAQQFIYFQF